jgi:3'-5' exoribonuclease
MDPGTQDRTSVSFSARGFHRPTETRCRNRGVDPRGDISSCREGFSFQRRLGVAPISLQKLLSGFFRVGTDRMKLHGWKSPLCEEAKMEPKRLPLTDWKIGEEIAGAAALVHNERRLARNGKPYLVTRLRHLEGQTELRVWSDRLDLFNGIETGSGVQIRARVKEGMNGEPELLLLGVDALPADHAIRKEMNPACPVPVSSLEARFAALKTLLSSPAKTLLDVGLDHYGQNAYRTAPAATQHHHAYLHGLFEHSIEVAEIALDLSRRCRMSALDRDIMIVGALLHDAGKTREMEWEAVPIRYSDHGRLLYHTAWGVAELAMAFAAQQERLARAGVSEDQRKHLLHIVLSHHGKQEWGSPSEPVSREAHLVHLADEASARMRKICDAIDNGTQEEHGWVRCQLDFRSRLLWAPSILGSATGGPHRKEEAETEIHGKPETQSNEENGMQRYTSGELAKGDHLRIEVSIDLAAYLCWTVSHDVKRWNGNRKSARLKREAAVAFATNLWRRVQAARGQPEPDANNVRRSP